MINDIDRSMLSTYAWILMDSDIGLRAGTTVFVREHKKMRSPLVWGNIWDQMQFILNKPFIFSHGQALWTHKAIFPLVL